MKKFLFTFVLLEYSVGICKGDIMLFLDFNSKEDRMKHGSSAFIEMQFCRLPTRIVAKDIVAVKNINHWQNDSLYINDQNIFYQEYSHVFNCGIYNNLKSGVVDIYGINYYAPSFIDSIIEILCEKKPVDYESLVEWLNKAKQYNGFYILGL